MQIALCLSRSARDGKISLLIFMTLHTLSFLFILLFLVILLLLLDTIADPVVKYFVISAAHYATFQKRKKDLESGKSCSSMVFNHWPLLQSQNVFAINATVKFRSKEFPTSLTHHFSGISK